MLCYIKYNILYLIILKHNIFYYIGGPVTSLEIDGKQ